MRVDKSNHRKELDVIRAWLAKTDNEACNSDAAVYKYLRHKQYIKILENGNNADLFKKSDTIDSDTIKIVKRIQRNKDKNLEEVLEESLNDERR